MNIEILIFGIMRIIDIRKLGEFINLIYSISLLYLLFYEYGYIN